MGQVGATTTTIYRNRIMDRATDGTAETQARMDRVIRVENLTLKSARPNEQFPSELLSRRSRLCNSFHFFLPSRPS